MSDTDLTAEEGLLAAQKEWEYNKSFVYTRLIKGGLNRTAQAC